MPSHSVVILFLLFLLNLLFSSSSSHVQDLHTNTLGYNSSAIGFLHNKTKFPALILVPTYDYLCGRARYIILPNVGRMFYFFFESRDGSHRPVVIWLNGGPGVSSSVGLFYENGPFHIADDLSLAMNLYGWDTVSNILYIDQPLTTGFSQLQLSQGNIGDTRRRIAKDLYNFLQEFFRIHHQYSQNQFFIAGQSYAAHYASALGMYIQRQNEVPSRSSSQFTRINLVGIAVGNPFTDLKIQIPTIPEYAFQNGYITTQQYSTINASVISCLQSIEACRTVGGTDLCETAYNDCDTVIQQTIIAMAPARNPANTRQHRPQSFDPRTHVFYDYSRVEALLNSSPIRERLSRLGVNHIFHVFNQYVFDSLKSEWATEKSQSNIFYLLDRGIKVLSYTGVDDFVWNAYGTYRAVTNSEWRYRQEFNSVPYHLLYVNYRTYGNVKSHRGLTYVKMHDAGNSVSRDQPEAALDMINRWMHGTLYPN